jgi:hypothetical protein
MMTVFARQAIVPFRSVVCLMIDLRILPHIHNRIMNSVTAEVWLFIFLFSRNVHFSGIYDIKPRYSCSVLSLLRTFIYTFFLLVRLIFIVGDDFD